MTPATGAGAKRRTPRGGEFTIYDLQFTIYYWGEGGAFTIYNLRFTIGVRARGMIWDTSQASSAFLLELDELFEHLNANGVRDGPILRLVPVNHVRIGHT